MTSMTEKKKINFLMLSNHYAQKNIYNDLVVSNKRWFYLIFFRGNEKNKLSNMIND